MGIDLKKIKELKTDKIITIILVGVLLLVVCTPVKDKSDSKEKDTVKDSYQSIAEYYEQRLDSILEDSYGEGTMEVMVHISEDTGSVDMYGQTDKRVVIDGVLIVADVDGQQAVSDITYAVSALFDLPAHKVAVIIKK